MLLHILMLLLVLVEVVLLAAILIRIENFLDLNSILNIGE